MLAVIVALSVNSYLSQLAFDRALVPEMEKKALTVGASVRALILKAVENRIELRQLYGVEQKFDELKSENPEFSYMALTDPSGAILFERFEPPSGAAAHFRTPAVLAPLSNPEAPSSAVRVGAQYVVSIPIAAGDGPIGMFHIGVDAGFVDSIVLEMLYDVLVVLVVALFFTLELLNFIAGASIEAGLLPLAKALERGRHGDFTTSTSATSHEFGSVVKLLEAAAQRVSAGYEALVRDIEAARRDPVHERTRGLGAACAGLRDLQQRFRFGAETNHDSDGGDRLIRVRAPLFAFILAEELTRSFMPTYVKDLAVAIPGLSTEIVVGLPIALFMLIVAIGQPYLAAYSERVGHKRTMSIGAGIAAVGFVATALAYNVLDLLLWRSLCAVGYGMVFVAAQGIVLHQTAASNRAQGFAVFVAAIMVASVCGPSIGGILADNIGERWTFAISAVLALVSIPAIRLLPDDTPQPKAGDTAARGSRLSDITSLMANRRFVTLTGLAAMPAKIILTGVCFYLVPLYMVTIGSSQAMAGRILMTYAVVMVLVTPLASALANTRERRECLVAAGLLVSGLGGVLMLASPGVSAVFAAVFFVGLGQALSITAQSALVSDHCQEQIRLAGEHTVYGVYRLLERCGNALGPLIAGGLVVAYGYQRSFVAIGALVLACGIAFVVSTRIWRCLVPSAETNGNLLKAR
jgi:MFS family permease